VNCVGKPIGTVMPEAVALRGIRWQLFATLTFAEDRLPRGLRVKRLFQWLRHLNGAKTPVPWKRLRWFARWETGGRIGRGHYHLCIAGLQPECVNVTFAHAAERAWLRFAASRGEVALWNPALDGAGYALKLPETIAGKLAIEQAQIGCGWEDCEPMLSDSVRDAIRRGPM